MRSPFTDGVYKDKPVSGVWRYRSLKSRILSRRNVAAIATILIVSFLLLYRDTSQRSRIFDPYRDEDLFVEPTWYSTSLISTLAAARRDRLARSTENVFLLLNGLTDSDTNLVSLGCQMSTSGEGVMVHFIILGGGQALVDNYRQVNQFDETCLAKFHDARVTPTFYREPAKAYASFASNALTHIVFNHKPRAIIFTSSDVIPKPSWFLAAIAPHRPYVTVIELQHNSILELGWMATLSPSSLNAWNMPRIDIIIDVSSHAGTIKRLVDSLLAAKYPSQRVPFLIMNLAPTAAEGSLQLIKTITDQWPPERILLRRSQSSHSTESWYPINERHYALFLIESDEVSPYYFQYLLATLLRYRYGSPGRLGSEFVTKTCGITLLPSDTTGGVSLHNKPYWQGTLIYPEHFTASQDSPDDWASYVAKNKTVVISPPRFDFGGQSFSMLRQAQVESLDLTEPLGSDSQPQLLEHKDWWPANLGIRLPFWSELPLFDMTNKEVALHDFFRDDIRAD